MKNILIGPALLCLVCLTWMGISDAEFWIPLPKHTTQVYYDRESIQFPNMKVYDLGLFTFERQDKDVIQVWTKLDTPDNITHRLLYEIKFSKKVFKVIYAVDQFGNRIPPYDSAYQPILPGTMEGDLYDWTVGWVRPESLRSDLMSRTFNGLQP